MHVIAASLVENVPQLVLQYYFIFHLELVTGIVVLSFLSSIFNLLNTVFSVIVFFILHRNQVEIPFTLNVSWSKKHNKLQTALAVALEEAQQIQNDHVDALESASRGKRDLDPFTQCGRRKELSKLLSQINVDNEKPLKFEITASKKDESRCTLFGVFVTRKDSSRALVRTRNHQFESFMDRELQIKEAVISAFKLDPEYTDQFVFSVSITQTSSVSSSDRAKLGVDGLRHFKVTKDIISAIRQEMTVVLNAEDAESENIPPPQTAVEMTSAEVTDTNAQGSEQ